ncbi:MAG TPA: hypothetical protein VEP48_08815 [Methylomirabilota bacterium]|nr:hypothetical protein [Methylomirabilota bacterium]
MSDAGGTALSRGLILDEEVSGESGFADDDIAAEQQPHLLGPKAVQLDGDDRAVAFDGRTLDAPQDS